MKKKIISIKFVTCKYCSSRKRFNYDMVDEIYISNGHIYEDDLRFNCFYACAGCIEFFKNNYIGIIGSK